MVAKKVGKKASKKEEGMSLEDAFGDDEDVEYAKPKIKKEKKNMKKINGDAMEELIEDAENAAATVNGVGAVSGDYTIQASKPIAAVKKGDSLNIDGKMYEVDSHYVLINHGGTNEMAIELFDSKTDKDYQLRYFDDQVETTLEFYELQEIMYVKKGFSKISW